MKAVIALTLPLLFCAQTFAQDSILIEGKFIHRRDCNSRVLANAVVGKVSGTGRPINACAKDVLTLKEQNFTNGATHTALINFGTYFIVGKLHEGTLSVVEVAEMLE